MPSASAVAGSAGDDVEQSHKVGDGAGHRTCSVALVVKSNHAGPGNQRPTWAQTNKGIVGDGIADRAKGVGPKAHDTKTRGKPRSGATRRSAGRVGGVVGITGKTGEHRVDVVD